VAAAGDRFAQAIGTQLAIAIQQSTLFEQARTAERKGGREITRTSCPASMLPQTLFSFEI